jgi:hypothetical protein
VGCGGGFSIAKVERAIDRVRNEEIALILEWNQSKRVLSAWTTAATKLRQMLQQFGEASLSHVRCAVNVLRRFSVCLSEISERFASADDARVPLSSTRLNNPNNVLNSTIAATTAAADGLSSVSVSPLEALARGTMGTEVASLILALRLHLDELVKAEMSLKAAVTTAEDSLASEMKNLQSWNDQIGVFASQTAQPSASTVLTDAELNPSTNSFQTTRSAQEPQSAKKMKSSCRRSH